MTALLRKMLAIIGVILAAGLGLHLAGESAGDTLIVGGLAALLAVPIGSVVRVLVIEIRRRQWGFAAAAAAVIAELAYVALQ